MYHAETFIYNQMSVHLLLQSAELQLVVFS